MTIDLPHSADKSHNPLASVVAPTDTYLLSHCAIIKKERHNLYLLVFDFAIVDTDRHVHSVVLSLVLIAIHGNYLGYLIIGYQNYSR